MQIFSLYLIEESNQFINQLQHDPRIQVKYPYAFCLQQNIKNIENDYKVLFSNGCEALMDLLMGDIEIECGLDLMFRDDIRLSHDYSLLFYNNFEMWLEKISVGLWGCLEYIYGNEKFGDKYLEVLECVSKLDNL